jgi:hypothetical protein
MAKADLLLQAQNLGLEVDESMTVKQIQELIDTVEPTPEPEKPKGLDLSQFDYKNLKGKSFTEYAKFVAKLNGNESHVFDVFKIDPIKQQRYKGMSGSPVDIIGIEIKNDTPIHSTKMALRNANTLNGIVIDEDGNCVSAQFENTKRIYLLKK